jgi:flagellar protein FliL
VSLPMRRVAIGGGKPAGQVRNRAGSGGAMSDETGADEDGEEPGDGPKKGRRKLFIIAGAAVVVLLAIGGGAYFTLFAGKGGGDQAMLANVKPTYFYDLPTLTVNLNNNGKGQDHFLKVAISLELANKEMEAVVVPRMPKVLDAFQVYLRELRQSDLEGSAGIYRLKEELRRRVNLAVYPAKVESILFKQILVQ